MQILYCLDLDRIEAIGHATSYCGAPKNVAANVHEPLGLLSRMPFVQSVREARNESRSSVLRGNDPKTYPKR
ncbi:hypothetical protein AT1219_10719 [Vibrio alginolyticus]